MTAGQNFKYHPAADIFPMMDLQSQEFKDLVTNIREHGQIEPCVLHEGMILDGRNRFLACKAAGIPPDS
jgi:ParB-like chromosome segregation protein Spo0J